MRTKKWLSIHFTVGGLLLLIGAFLLINSLIPLINVQMLSNSPAQSAPWLHTLGTELYDSNNNTARLYLAIIQDGQGFHVSKGDIQYIVDMGFKGVRFFIYWGQCQPTADSVSTEYFSSGSGEPGNNSIDDIVNWSQEAGLYIVLCPCWTSYWQPPAWAISARGLTCADDNESHVDFFNIPAIQASVNYLYSFIANRYASFSNVIFESFNELQSESYPCSVNERQQFADFNNKWISAVEANEGPISHIKVLQLFYDWCDTNYVLYTPVLSGSHSSILMAVHSYPLAKSPYLEVNRIGTEWANFVHGLNYPLTCTEGSNQQGGNLSQWAMEIVNLGFVGWGYFDFEPSSVPSFYNVNNPTSAETILPILQPYMAAYKW